MSGLARLGEVKVVLGPCDDGGDYLIGMQSGCQTFSGIPWSTSEVAKLTVKKCKALGLTVAPLDRMMWIL